MPPVTDPWGDPEVREWVGHVLTEVVPKMEASSVTVSLLPESGRGDVKFWVELGASIMLNKPIIAVVVGDGEVPERLVRVADEVVRLSDLDDGGEELAAAIQRVLGRG